MRDLLRGYATAIFESAAKAGRAHQVASDLGAFSRALTESDPLRNVLTDVAIPPRARRGVVHDLLDAKAAPESQALVSWAALVERAAEFPVAVLELVELALETADAQEVGRPELIDDIEDELVRFARIVDSNRGLRRALGDPSAAVAQRVALVDDLLRAKVLPATVRLVAYVLRAGHIRDFVGTLEWVAGLAAEERGRRVAEVRSAVELDDDEYLRLVEALERTAGHPVEVRVQIEPSLLGGMAVEIGDTVIDGSVRHRLDQLREALAPSTALRDLSTLEHDRS
jgi:F-type H+-transporting ATPase subunit delta